MARGGVKEDSYEVGTGNGVEDGVSEDVDEVGV